MHLLRPFLLALFLALAPLATATAQTPPDGEGAQPAVAVVVPDPFGRETPRSSITNLIEALAAQDYARAANYFDLPVQTDPRVANGAAELARRLQSALDSGGVLDGFGALSNEAGGVLDDGLTVDREQVGLLREDDGAEVPVQLTRGSGTDGQPIWRISHDTIRHLMQRPIAPAANEQAVETPVVAGAPFEDWALLLGLAAASFLVFRVIAAGIRLLMRRTITNPDQSALFRFAEAALPPLSLFLAVIAFYQWGERLEVAIVARQTLLRYAGIVAAIALVWFLLRLVDAIATVAVARMQRHERRQAVSIISLLRRTAKILLLVVAAVAILDTFGVDVTTGIAALGIGGIALALGAQKTVENLVGSVTVIADRPVQVGDFCRVGAITGTVEDVGIRSTRIRTNERTIVTIPNGNFSSLEIENFATRDRFLFNPLIGIEYGLSPAKIRETIAAVEQVLTEHPKVAEGARARLANFGASAVEIETFSYIATSDFDESLVIRQDLLLTIAERLEAVGAALAFPTQTIHLVRDRAPHHDRASEAGAA